MENKPCKQRIYILHDHFPMYLVTQNNTAQEQDLQATMFVQNMMPRPNLNCLFVFLCLSICSSTFHTQVLIRFNLHFLPRCNTIYCTLFSLLHYLMYSYMVSFQQIACITKFSTLSQCPQPIAWSGLKNQEHKSSMLKNRSAHVVEKRPIAQAETCQKNKSISARCHYIRRKYCRLSLFLLSHILPGRACPVELLKHFWVHLPDTRLKYFIIPQDHDQEA